MTTTININGLLRALVGLVILGLLALAPISCGGSAGGPQRGAVRGKVSLDGEPVESGSITFFPTGDTQGPVSGGQIDNGSYSIAGGNGPVVGRNRVEIRWPRNTGNTITLPADGLGSGEMTQQERVEAIPAKYNANSTLIHQVKPGKNTIDFELKSD